ncbi:MAG: hypothetical protein JWR35_1264 [Marmoricola sp.]|nr:hypothetical protein [Marmoricola sp.]
MGAGSLAAIGGAAVALVIAGVLVATLLSDRRAIRRHLDQSRAETDELRRRLDEIGRQLADRTAAEKAKPPVEFLITDAGELVAADQLTAVPDRLVLSATLGEPLVKVVALGHGVRRALSAESRNRIWFEMRKEVRRARKQRRRDVKAAMRRLRSEDAA